MALKRTFNLQQQYRVVIYLRVSKTQKHGRSPEQQEAIVRETIKRLSLPWIVVKTYRDDNLSGKLVRKRPGYQKMLRDIETGLASVDLILTDTTERFGRIKDLQTIRRKLYQKYGVLLLTADTSFADPTTPLGEAYTAFEAMRAAEDSRVKGHQVWRGKKDFAERHFWPGGIRPFGLRLVAVLGERGGRQVVVGHVPEPEPEEDWIIRLAFTTARDEGWGQIRVTKSLNANLDIPDKFKPFHPTTVGRWLQNPIYYGHLSWGRLSSDIIDDAIVRERNAPEDRTEIDDFCPPIIDKETFDVVQEMRLRRAEALQRARNVKPDANGKLIKPLAPGLTLKYLLSGLVRCGHCGASMTVSANKYKRADGGTTTYVKYVCPRSIGGLCPNRKRVPEEWLREQVVSTLLGHFR